MVLALGLLSVCLVAGAAVLGGHHPIPGGALMALALVAALSALVLDSMRHRTH